MVQLTTSSAVLLAAVLSAHLVAAGDFPPQFKSEDDWQKSLDKHNKDADCDNGCFFPEFTNKCNSDNPACMCTLKPERERYFCCLAKKCDTNVLPDSIERQVTNCNAWNKPIPTEFDTEAVCGIKKPAASSSSAAPASTASTASAASSPTATKAPDSSVTAAATPSGSATKTGSETPAAASSSTPPKSGASQVKSIWGGAAVLLTAFGFLI
ncbi:hypothetical protein PG990_008466 [Apiospora arundinis]|uniref:Extracellular membrane protein CFEM domain-containing protein n=1 Tax=Apiospora arundinis TaxID=335852 RepID=A0ABR2JMQ2_9PEZI